MLRESELRVLQNVGEELSITEIAEQLDRSSSYISEVVSELEETGLVYTRREGKEKLVKPVDSKAIEHLQELGQRYSHIDFPDLIAGKAIPLLYYLDDYRTVAELAEKTGNYRNTVNRIVTRLVNRGILQKDGSKYRLNDEFQLLHEFAEELVHHVHRQTAAEHASQYTILWESLHEFLIQTREEISHESFTETGPVRFQDYDLPLLTTSKRYYVYTRTARELTPEDLVCHTLLIDDGTRYRTYCLLLVQKQGIEREQLLETAQKYGVEKPVQSLIGYLDSRGENTSRELPEWSEFESTAADYEVEL